MTIMTQTPYKLQVFTEQSGSRTPVLLLGESVDLWRFTAESLSRYFRVILPEISFSAFQNSGHELMEYVQKLLDELAIQKVSVIGHSLGTLAACHLLQEIPERIEAVIISGITPCDEHYLEQHFRGQRASRVVAREILRRYPAAPDFPYYKTGNLIRESLEQQLAPLLHYLNPCHVSSTLEDHHIPTLLLWGEKNEVAPITTGYYWKNQLKELVLFKTIRHMGHYLMIEHPVYYTRLLQEFLLCRSSSKLFI